MRRNCERQHKIAGLMHLMLYVNRQHRIMADAGISKLGIHSSQHHMLVIIAKNSNICQKEIAQRLEISSAAVAVTLNKLEASGLIVRNPSYDDARMNRISITDKGNELLKSTRAMFSELDERFFEGITDEELEAMKSLFCRLAENLKGIADSQR